MNKVVKLAEVTNGAEDIIAAGLPYQATVTIQGSSDFLFHRWNNEAVEAKAKAAKGSKAKKSDDIESYVYRNDAGELAIPGEYLRMAIIGAAKFRQDPRSPRKSAMDLFKAAVISLTPLASLGTSNWSYEGSAPRGDPAQRCDSRSACDACGMESAIRPSGQYPRICGPKHLARDYRGRWQANWCG